MQGFIYRNLSKTLAKSLHDQGLRFEKRQFKLFTFSRLFGRFEIRDQAITFRGPLFFWVASPMVRILESFASHIVKKRRIKLGNAYFQPTSVEVSFDEPAAGPILVRTLSPVTAYSTLQSGDGKRKTYYYSPFEKEFSSLVEKNLIKKWMTLHKALPEGELLETGSSMRFKIWPERVSERNHHILSFKGTVIRAWSGLYRIEGSEELMKVAFDCGLGAKNSQGFGMIEKYEYKHR